MFVFEKFKKIESSFPRQFSDLSFYFASGQKILVIKIASSEVQHNYSKVPNNSAAHLII